jgi:hypothetical protein
MSTKDNHVNQSDDLDRYIKHLYGERTFYIQICKLDPTKPKDEAWDEGKPVAYMPSDVDFIARKIRQIAADGLNAYVSAHGYIDNRRGGVKANAAPIDVLWVERDDATIPPDVPAPTMTIETSPGRFHDYWRLSRTIAPEVAENLNRRLTQRIGGDSGYALTKRLRPPETINDQPKKRPGRHEVRLVTIDDERTLDPDELDRLLPKVKATAQPNPNSTGVNPDDEPPILLSPAALAFWRGERRVMRKDDPETVDRSGTLYKIGADLWEHGANRRLIISELAARDISLGWNRYTDYPEEYARVADKVSAKPRLIGPIGTSGSADTSASRATFTNSADEDACSVELAKTKAELAESRRVISGLIHTFLNPHMPQSEKVALFSVHALAEQKRESGEVREDGSIEISTAEVSDDWRQAPQPGESVAPTNKDGSKPRMSRDKVKPAIKALVDRGLVSATPRKVVQVRANGTRYSDEVWDVTPTNMAESLAMSAKWKPEQPKERKPRSRNFTCPHCDEIHPIKRQDYCCGCGALRTETIIQPDYDAADAPNEQTAEASPPNPDHVRKNSGHRETARDVAESYVRKNSGQGERPPEAPASPFMPGFDSPRVDRYTDTSIGGRP